VDEDEGGEVEVREDERHEVDGHEQSDNEEAAPGDATGLRARCHPAGKVAVAPQ